MNKGQILEDLKQKWVQYSDDSDVWVFQSSLVIEDRKAQEIIEESRKFTLQWSSHGTALEATAALFYDRFLIFIVNGSDGPSGCSKDSLTHFIQSIGKKYEIDFFNRMQVLYKGNNGEIIDANLNDFKIMHEKNEISRETTVYNNLVKNKLELLNNWEVPIKGSWHNQFI